MEDTLRVYIASSSIEEAIVLILVLMEDTLRASKENRNGVKSRCFNPCFNGRYSQRVKCFCVTL